MKCDVDDSFYFECEGLVSQITEFTLNGSKIPVVMCEAHGAVFKTMLNSIASPKTQGGRRDLSMKVYVVRESVFDCYLADKPRSFMASADIDYASRFITIESAERAASAYARENCLEREALEIVEI